jgi:UDP-glucose 4-epimerase
MSILITGGAGYIGSVAVEDLCSKGESPVVIDNLSRGHRAAVGTAVPFYEGNIGDTSLVTRIVDEHEVEAVMHFSAFAYVGESVRDPGKYFENNVAETLRLLTALADSGVRRFVFSSTCATYGEPEYTPIDESHPQKPTNPYGWSKLFVERMLQSFDEAHDTRSVSLRYFNAAGATEKLGEHHEPETHLIPLVLAAAAGERPDVSIFGTDYPTNDGTAVRDYIHVSDISRAHILALQYLRSGGTTDAFNLGNGNGYSVREIISAAEDVTGCKINATESPRRPGDPSTLVANASRAREILGWEPEHTDIEEMISSAWRWRSSHPHGYSVI